MLARLGVLSVVLGLLACRTPADEPVPRTTTGAPTATEVVEGGPAQVDAPPVEVAVEVPAQPASRVSATLYTPPSTLGEPIAIRRASLPRPVFVEPRAGATLRGRIEMGEAFHVYALHDGEEGDGCSRAWARVGEAAWVCTKHSEPDEHGKPHALPVLPKGHSLPFLYARHVRHDDRDAPKLPVYRHLTALRSGAEPVEWLYAFGTYAFVRRTRGRDPVLIDIRGRVVPADDMRIFDAPAFAGRDLEAAPVPADRTLGWVIHRKTGVYAQPDLEAEFKPLAYHAELLLLEPAAGDPSGWIRVPATRAGEPGEIASEGWIPAAHVRVWRPLPVPEPVLTGQRLIDVDLDQQVLTFWREDRPVFATLVASGKPGYSTPLGLYRIITKRAYGKMASLPSEPEPYWVDAVPWTMYFDGRFALHGAFWHDRFGYRTSHGCINLSPRDAKYLFDQSTPTLLPGWLLVDEHASDPGTLVRIRKGAHPVPDRRKAALEGAAQDD